MEYISIQSIEINKLKEQVKNLEYGKKLAEVMHEALAHLTEYNVG